MLRKLVRFRAVILLAGVDGLFFGVLNPHSNNSFVIITGCIILAISLYVFCAAVLSIFARMGVVRRASTKRLSVFLALFLAFIILMQSIGQLGIRDMFAIVPFACVLYLYSTYISTKVSTKDSYLQN